MKAYFYFLLTIGSLLATAPAQATTGPASPENPTEIQRKTAARAKVVETKKAAAAAATTKRSVWSKTRKSTAKVNNKLGYAMMVVLGLEESKAVTSPAKLTRQLHAHQRQLKMKARINARARRARVHQ
ncbi:hypothetical protein [Hymenobacter antarcticus]|uniref:Uncharacterized protein n=1 Tax=Hymenobacter antarcticus TaxID=486270 RepID=A0ABP7R6T9_9BACT